MIEAAERPLTRGPRPHAVAFFQTVVRDPHGRVKYRSPRRHNLRTNAGADWQAAMMGGGAAIGSAATGTATTAPTATTATLDGVSAPGSTSKWNGQIITMGAAWAVVLSNTNAAPPVLTLDRWNDPTNPGGSAASTPSAGRWILIPGQAPAWWMALTADSASPAATDTSLASELTTNGFARAQGTYAHTGSSTTYTLSKTFSCTGGSTTINKEGVLNAQNGGVLAFESAEPSPPTLISGDSLAQTVSVSY